MKIKRMKKLMLRVVGVNILGTIGYMSSLFSWVLLAAVIVALVLSGSTVVPAEQVDPTPAQSTPNGLATGIAYVVTGVMIIITIAVFILLPYFIGKCSSASLRWLLGILRVAPTKRHMFLAKSIVATLPLVGFFVVTLLLTSPSMTFSIIYIVAVAAAAFALVCFLLQLIIARAMHIPERSIW